MENNIEEIKRYLVLHGHKKECLNTLPNDTIIEVYNIVKSLFDGTAN